MRIVLLFYKKLMVINMPLSLMIGGLGMMINPNHLVGFFTAFATSVLTGGFLLGLYYYEIVYKNTYYFFYNKGYSKARLIIYAYLLQFPVLIFYAL